MGSLDAADAVGTPQNAPSIHVVLNWIEELKQRVPTPSAGTKLGAYEIVALLGAGGAAQRSSH